MLDLISRLREPLSEQGRADFVQATVLSCVVGAVRGVSLVAFIPAAIALTSGAPAWGMSLGSWLAVLAACALTSFAVEYLLAMRSYSVAFDFLSNMHRAIGDKVASLPLGSFRADTAGKTSRLVSRELMVLGEIFAHRYSPLIAAIVTSATMLVGIAAFSPILGVVCLVAIPIVGGGVWVARRCLQSGAALKEPPARELSHCRIRDEAGGAARVRALRLLRAPPAGRRRLRGGRASLTHEGDGWPDRQRHGRPARRRDAHLRDGVARGRR